MASCGRSERGLFGPVASDALARRLISPRTNSERISTRLTKNTLPNTNASSSSSVAVGDVTATRDASGDLQLMVIST